MQHITNYLETDIQAAAIHRATGNALEALTAGADVPEVTINTIIILLLMWPDVSWWGWVIADAAAHTAAGGRGGQWLDDAVPVDTWGILGSMVIPL